MVGNRYNSLSGEAPVLHALDSQRPNVKRSAFNYSNTHNFNAWPMALIPTDWFQVNLGERLKLAINASFQLRSPLAKSMLSGWRAYFHWYYMSFVDLWEGSKNFFTLGDTGNVDLTIPQVALLFNVGGTKYSFQTPMSLSDYLGVPPKYFNKTNLLAGSAVLSVNSATERVNVGDAHNNVSALPFAMYQSVAKHRYMPRNLLQNNRNVFPVNTDDDILPYDIPRDVYQLLRTDAVADYNDSSLADALADILSRGHNSSATVLDGDDVPMLLPVLRWRQFFGDYFTTSLPFPDLIRGDVPYIGDINGRFTFTEQNLEDILIRNGVSTLALYGPSVVGVNSKVDYSNVVAGSSVSGGNYSFGVTNSMTDAVINTAKSQNLADTITNNSQIFIRDTTPRSTDINMTGMSITLNQLRALEVATLFKERMARTSGRYADMMDAQFGQRPRHVKEHLPDYIGGTSVGIGISTVMNTNGDGATPQGNRTGQAGGAGSGFCGSYVVPDNGLIMCIMSIMPESYYTDGISRDFTRKTQAEQYFPLFNNLSPQPILNKELFFGTDVTVNDDVFAYTERFSEWKSRQNRVSGLMRFDLNDFEDASYVFARRFNQAPQLNTRFVTGIPENQDLTVFVDSNSPPFICSVGHIVDRVEPMPRYTVPGGLSTRG